MNLKDIKKRLGISNGLINAKKIVITAVRSIAIGLILSIIAHNWGLEFLRNWWPCARQWFSMNRDYYVTIISINIIGGIGTGSISLWEILIAHILSVRYENYLKRLNVGNNASRKPYELSEHSSLYFAAIGAFVLFCAIIVYVIQYEYYCATLLMQITGTICLAIILCRMYSLSKIDKLQNHIRDRFNDCLSTKYASDISDLLNEAERKSHMMVLMANIKIDYIGMHDTNSKYDYEIEQIRIDFDFKVSLFRSAVEFGYENSIGDRVLYEFVRKFIKTVKVDLGTKFTDDDGKFNEFLENIVDSYKKCPIVKPLNHQNTKCYLLVYAALIQFLPNHGVSITRSHIDGVDSMKDRIDRLVGGSSDCDPSAKIVPLAQRVNNLRDDVFSAEVLTDPNIDQLEKCLGELLEFGSNHRTYIYRLLANITNNQNILKHICKAIWNIT